jgi:hypothetical protein
MDFLKKMLYGMGLSIIYLNMYGNNYKMTRVINLLYLVNTYQFKDDILNDLVNLYAHTKYYIGFVMNKIGKQYPEYYLHNAWFYVNLKDKINITEYFRNRDNIDRLDNDFFDMILEKEDIHTSPEYMTDIRIKLEFMYNHISYILYVPYVYKVHKYKVVKLDGVDKNSIKTIEDTDIYLKYPPYTNEIINDYRANIVIPNYEENNKRYRFYNFFTIDCKDIDEAYVLTVNGDKIDVRDYISKIQTPFHDNGLIYHVPVKISWLCNDNDIEVAGFAKLYIKYSNFYLNEDDYDLVMNDHIICRESVNDYVLSDIMKNYINSRNKSEDNILIFL